MKIKLTIEEIFERGLWMDLCELRGINEWARAEGQVPDGEEFEFTQEEAIKLGVLNESTNNNSW